MGEPAYWDVARRRWQVVVAFAQLGVGVALVASEGFDSPRPLRDIVVGLVVGLVIGLIAVRPAEQLTAPAPSRRGRHWQQPPRGRAAQPEVLVVEAAHWPHPELSEQPRPTFTRPRR